MAEVVSPVVNSRIMACAAREDTRPGVIFWTGRQAMTFHYRLCQRRLLCRSDLFYLRRRAKIRAHGCSWHDPNRCLLNWPTYWSKFWMREMGSRGGRDSVKLDRSMAAGWSVLDIWERAFKDHMKGLVGAALGEAGQVRRSGDRECELVEEI